jgi:hypothetical protein
MPHQIGGIGIHTMAAHAGDAVRNAAGGVAGLNGAVEIAPVQLGIFDTLVDQTAFRLIDIPYFNTTGHPMMVMAVVTNPAGASFSWMLSMFDTPGLDNIVGTKTVTFIVPIGGFYEINTVAGNPVIVSWYELS